MIPCQCVDGFTCNGCLRDMEAEWKYEHVKELEYERNTNQSEAQA